MWTIVLYVCFALFVLSVGDAFPTQNTQNGRNITSEQQSAHNLLNNGGSGQTVSSKTTPLPFFDCLGLGICQIGIHFCNERKKVCEKCEDYQHSCGTNHQPVNCTQYCVDMLVKRACKEAVTSIPTILPTTTETKEMMKLGASAEKPESCPDWKSIANVILVIIVVPSLFGNIYFLYHHFIGRGEQSTQMEYNELEQKLLPKDCPASSPVDTPRSLDFMGNEYVSDPTKDDNNGPCSVQPSAPFIPPDNSDQDQTSVKVNHKHLPSRENQGREHKVDLKDVIQMKMINDVQGREVDIDKQSSSGYSSASSTQSLNRSSVINNNFHISIINGQSDQSATVMKTEKDATQPENVWNEAHYGVEEIGTVGCSHAKPVSDDDQNAKIALLETSVDIDDLKK